MPGLDGSGPFGRGRLTGRGMGRCIPVENETSDDVVEDANENIGRFVRGIRCRGRFGRGLI